MEKRRLLQGYLLIFVSGIFWGLGGYFVTQMSNIGVSSLITAFCGHFLALGPADEIIDLGGKLVTAPYVDPHLHLDYVYTLSELGQEGAGSGTLFEAIEMWPKFKKNLTIESVKKLALKGIKDEVSQGVQHIRTHIDVTDPNFTALKAMLELKEELKKIVEIQIIAFPIMSQLENSVKSPFTT